MTDSENLVRAPRPEMVQEQRNGSQGAEASVDPRALLGWLKRHQVTVCGMLLIAAEVIWKAQFLRHMYFRRDDFVNQDIGLTSPLNWHYLSQVGDGHLSPGLRGITWVLVRISLYNWTLFAAVALAFVALASLAALRLLQTLFGSRPAILIPLAVYALTPLTVPDLGWWWCAIESVPFQLAMFMTIDAHVKYIRTGRWQSLAAACAWLAVSMLFFEKAMLLPPLLFAVTSGFLTETRWWLAGAVMTLKRHWKGWLAYCLMMGGYLAVFLLAFHDSTTRPRLPTAATTWAFSWSLLKNSLLTGAVGLQWRWLPFSDRLYAVVAPSGTVIFLAAVMALAVVVASVVIRARAWRAWVILLGWVIFADMVPILIGRVSSGTSPYYAQLFGLQTRYVAEAACVLALCLGLAFLPVTGLAAMAPQGRRRGLVTANPPHRGAPSVHPGLRYAAAAFVAVFVVGSIRSMQTYENSTSSGLVRSYIADVQQALKLAPRGTHVVDQDMPLWVLGPYFGRYNLESYVIGTLAKNQGRNSLKWISQPRGTIDGLRMFGNDGKLYPAVISGDYSGQRSGTGFAACWPERHSRIVVWFRSSTTSSDHTLHFLYIWGSAPSTVTVRYGGKVQYLKVLHNIHNAYLRVSGDVYRFAVSGLAANHMCITGAASGRLVPYGQPIP